VDNTGVPRNLDLSEIVTNAGTSEGAKKAWDTRGRGQKEGSGKGKSEGGVLDDIASTIAEELFTEGIRSVSSDHISRFMEDSGATESIMSTIRAKPETQAWMKEYDEKMTRAESVIRQKVKGYLAEYRSMKKGRM
jgi:hypothetical protein